jgi:hypothetical protein
VYVLPSSALSCVYEELNCSIRVSVQLPRSQNCGPVLSKRNLISREPRKKTSASHLPHGHVPGVAPAVFLAFLRRPQGTPPNILTEALGGTIVLRARNLCSEALLAAVELSVTLKDASASECMSALNAQAP